MMVQFPLGTTSRGIH